MRPAQPIRRAVLLALCALAVLARVAAARQGALDADAIYLRAAPAVAAIRIGHDATAGVGTGFAIDARGVLITAAHVARGADRITAEFGDGAPLEAELVGYDARRDVALLRVRPLAPLTTLEVVDSAGVQRGDPVAVIGTPRGRPRVMTTGSVQATGVTLPGQLPGIFIQFDAPVQPGNSGGPLLNDRGQVIGVVVALRRQPDGAAGLATSSAALRSTLPAMADGARLERAWIGLSGVTLGPDVRFGRGAPRGVLVLAVVPDSPAARVGLRGEHNDPPGDIIVAIDGEPIGAWEDLLRVLGGREPGQRIRLGLIRNGTYQELQLTLEARSS
ncbi:MAG: trypsin-like peptidase domain-containing protein [Armatimonadota bacterium]|nr:trypsin-like peptidase domain-containing protein [Armatimonadota bacterium]